MKVLSILLSLMLFTSIAFADFGYVTERSTGRIVSYYQLNHRPNDTLDYTFTTCSPNNKPPLYEAPQPKEFIKDDFDEWLLNTYTGTQVEAFFPIVSRATDKNTPRGYQLLVSYALNKGVAQPIIDSVINKLTELGANVGGE